MASSNNNNVVSLADFKKKQRQDIQVKYPPSTDAELAERIERIKASITRINKVIAELRATGDKKNV
jgi:hypothetical protein